jgi:hypothetical protein
VSLNLVRVATHLFTQQRGPPCASHPLETDAIEGVVLGYQMAQERELVVKERAGGEAVG